MADLRVAPELASVHSQFMQAMVSYRNRCGFTQLQLVERMQKATHGDSLIKHWERGRRLPTPEQFACWATAVQLTQDEELDMLALLVQLRPRQWPNDLHAQSNVYTAYRTWCACWAVYPHTGLKSALTAEARSGITSLK